MVEAIQLLILLCGGLAVLMVLAAVAEILEKKL